VAEMGVHGVADRRAVGDAEGRAQPVHRVGRPRRLGALDAGGRLADVGHWAALEVLEVLTEGVEVGVGVAVDRVVLVLPVVGGDRRPDVVRGGRQVDLADDLELAAHGLRSFSWVMLGCSATTKRWSRPRAAFASWYLATRALTDSASSAANAARSRAEAKRIS